MHLLKCLLKQFFTSTYNIKTHRKYLSKYLLKQSFTQLITFKSFFLKKVRKTVNRTISHQWDQKRINKHQPRKKNRKTTKWHRTRKTSLEKWFKWLSLTLSLSARLNQNKDRNIVDWVQAKWLFSTPKESWKQYWARSYNKYPFVDRSPSFCCKLTFWFPRAIDH